MYATSTTTMRLATTALAALALAGAASAGGDCDERIAIDNPARFPFNTIGALRFDTDDDGDYDSIGSGVLIAPYTILTCGHCVYSRSNEAWKTGTITFCPAMHLDDDGDVVYPYGTRDDYHLHTNTKWTDPDYSASGDVDYGAIHFVCPFEELTTFMPVCFDYDPSFINMSGYPIEDLPDSSRTYDQWRDADSVYDVQARRVYYDARSTGGASGAPSWVYFGGDERYIIGVNRAHTDACDGVATRLVWNNEDLIRDWMEWEPTYAEKAAAGCLFSGEPMPYQGILDHYFQNPHLLIPAQQLRLTNPIIPPPTPPARRIFQVIENGFYEWEEFLVEPQDPDSLRYLRMVSPEPHWLGINEARALLTASARWVDEVPFGDNMIVGEPEDLEPHPLPVDAHVPGPPDLTVDFDAEFVTTCIGDLNADGVVDVSDILIALASWGTTGGDLNGDGTTDVSDLLLMLAAWGPC